ncbi:hypothetical protein [Kitasatospora sp. NPDC048407]|uniref:hypothetical protein n=1 Tax=Kitasatospora sp. NPDC048407 TaxID=3364051 RepID=UPI00370F865E
MQTVGIQREPGVAGGGERAQHPAVGGEGEEQAAAVAGEDQRVRAVGGDQVGRADEEAVVDVREAAAAISR